ncbi:MAG TPA: hypothetical protein VHL31_20020 [Geminicoccus sp.]|jgi:hypothetical protein|uniref:hypothetical protein n=1 Tax=Geminicoccus sp. TaxID=2024832 RepID=UPI002E349FBA|nr:hypothetical protein [Geminicoccus sp.]HEX2528567.1 hypothetical protein [Geminicoccus sp.]
MPLSISAQLQFMAHVAHDTQQNFINGTRNPPAGDMTAQSKEKVVRNRAFEQTGLHTHAGLAQQNEPYEFTPPLAIMDAIASVSTNRQMTTTDAMTRDITASSDAWRAIDAKPGRSDLDLFQDIRTYIASNETDFDSTSTIQQYAQHVTTVMSSFDNIRTGLNAGAAQPLPAIAANDRFEYYRSVNEDFRQNGNNNESVSVFVNRYYAADRTRVMQVDIDRGTRP